MSQPAPALEQRACPECGRPFRGMANQRFCRDRNCQSLRLHDHTSPLYAQAREAERLRELAILVADQEADDTRRVRTQRRIAHQPVLRLDAPTADGKRTYHDVLAAP